MGLTGRAVALSLYTEESNGGIEQEAGRAGGYRWKHRRLTVTKFIGGRVKIGIKATKNIRVLRGELAEEPEDVDFHRQWVEAVAGERTAPVKHNQGDNFKRRHSNEPDESEDQPLPQGD